MGAMINSEVQLMCELRIEEAELRAFCCRASVVPSVASCVVERGMGVWRRCGRGGGCAGGKSDETQDHGTGTRAQSTENKRGGCMSAQLTHQYKRAREGGQLVLLTNKGSSRAMSNFFWPP